MDPAWILLLSGVGLLLMVVEVFVPSGGLIAVFAGGCLIASIFGSFGHGLGWGLAHMAGAIAFTAIILVWAIHRLSHKGSQPVAEGYSQTDSRLTLLQGKQGKALTPLRPAGTAMVEGQRLSVVTRGDFIEAQTAIEVVQVEGSRVVVKSV